MLRPIDANKLEEKVREYFKEKITRGVYAVDTVNCSVDICGMVEEQPTVFDVEKVVEELENLREVELSRPDMCGELGDGDGEAQYNDGVSQGRYEAFIEAIKIVKRGGRNEK